MYKNNLTFIQRAALEGEVAFLIATSNHDEDILFRLYCVLDGAPDDIRELFLSCFKSFVHFPEETYTKILGEVQTQHVPMWLWEDKVIADIKGCLKFTESSDSENLKMSKEDLRKYMVKSAFIFFCKKVCGYSVSEPIYLCQKIIEDNKLDFLHSVCFALIRDLSEALELGLASPDDSGENLVEIFKLSFDSHDLLSYRQEVNAMEQLIKEEQEEREYYYDFLFNIAAEAGKNKELSADIKQVISELLEVHNKQVEKGKKRKNPFVVKKILNTSKAISTLKRFKTVDEAQDYIEKMVDKCPELTDTCTFVIEDFNKKDVIYVYNEN
ncbi:MAG: hypothetical protein K6C94_02985 [Candidatus Gastranaerophilales bacterium]|nr:hypothetical protein [Candidatus Gastranaerophilales bacterium]